MKGQFRKLLCVCIATVMMITAVGVIPVGSKAYAETKVDPCDYLEGSNLDAQDYNVWSAPVESYLVKAGNGYMRIQTGYYVDGIAVEYYDKDFYRTGKKTITPELPIFGAFYESDDNYFLVTGQANDKESDDVEVFRITKYDKDWNKISHASLYGANTTLPFEGGTCRVAASGDFMIVRTCHQMYTSSDGLRHQANLTMLLNTDQMEILDSKYGVSNNRTGYVSHSFNQFVEIEGNKIVAVDHGDAYPRAAILMKYPIDITEGSLSTYDCENTNILEFYGQVGANATHASVGGFEVMGDSYLVAGSSIIQDEDDPDFNANSKTRNIYVASVNKETKELTFNWITDYPDTDKSLTTTSNPHLVKINDNKSVLVWERQGTVYYATVDGQGNVTSEIYSFEGALSDCAPLVDDGNLIWYTWEDAYIDFYIIDVSDLSDYIVVEKNYEHAYEFSKIEDTTVTLECPKCKSQTTGEIVTDYDIWWRDTTEDSYYYYRSIKKMDLNETCNVWIDGLYDSDYDYNQMVIELEDPDMGIIDKYSVDHAEILWQKEGKAKISIYPKYMPSLKKTYNIWIGDIPITEEQDFVLVDNNTLTYTGQELKPEAEIYSLTEDKDYTVSYENNVNAGTATVIFTGIGDYKDTIKYDFTIKKASISNQKIVLDDDIYTYTGESIEPKVNITGLTKDVDYTVSYENNVRVGTGTVIITGIGNYKGTVKKNFTIEGIPIKGMKTIIDDKAYTYTSKSIKPKASITGLTKDVDYTVSYKNNVNAGTAQIILTGKGNYKGTITAEFTIGKASISGKTTKLQYTAYHYSGENKKPKVTVSGLKSGTDYYVTYKNNKNVGKATATVIGKGNYKGTINKTFTIKPTKTSITSLKAGDNRFTVKWKKRTTQVTGYQVMYSTSSKFKSKKTTTRTINNIKTIAKTYKGLKNKRLYYVKVRTYKTVNGVKYYSNWSAVKKIPTK